MTERTRGQKWLMAAFFTAISLFFAYFIITVSKGNIDPAFNRRPPGLEQRWGETPPDGELVLRRNRPLAYGRLILTYRGMDSGDILLDVVLLELDPDYAYRRRIPRERAALGVRLANKDFRIHAASRTKLSLTPTGPRQ